MARVRAVQPGFHGGHLRAKDEEFEVGDLDTAKWFVPVETAETADEQPAARKQGKSKSDGAAPAAASLV